MTAKKFSKNDDNAFTGLEAAIVLIAFVVVAAVFSYVVLGAGFFTTQKAQETVYSGVEESTSSFEVVGMVYGIGTTTPSSLSYIKFNIANTAGGTPMDISKVIVSYTDETNRINGMPLQDSNTARITSAQLLSAGGDSASKCRWGILEVLNPVGTDNNLLQQGEQFVIGIAVPNTATVNKKITVTLQPPNGAAVPIAKTIPAGIDPVTVLK